MRQLKVSAFSNQRARHASTFGNLYMRSQPRQKNMRVDSRLKKEGVFLKNYPQLQLAETLRKGPLHPGSQMFD